MPTKQVSYRNDKAVQVRVYVEKPRNKTSSSIHHHHHIHYHIHHTVRQQEVGDHGYGNKGYDRRSGLLMYSHLLRESAKGASSIPSFSKWVANYNLQPPTQIAPSNKKRPEYEEKPTCFGIWKLVIPSFLRSKSKSQNKEKKKKQMAFLSQVWRGKNFIKNVFSTKHKR